MKISESKLRKLISEAVMNEIMTGAYMNPDYRYQEDLKNPESHVRKLGDEVLRVIYDYCQDNGLDFNPAEAPQLLQPVIKKIIYGV